MPATPVKAYPIPMCPLSKENEQFFLSRVPLMSGWAGDMELKFQEGESESGPDV